MTYMYIYIYIVQHAVQDSTFAGDALYLIPCVRYPYLIYNRVYIHMYVVLIFEYLHSQVTLPPFSVPQNTQYKTLQVVPLRETPILYSVSGPLSPLYILRSMFMSRSSSSTCTARWEGRRSSAIQ
jgi:hypothetical protein